jgi:hypothetical protein
MRKEENHRDTEEKTVEQKIAKSAKAGHFILSSRSLRASVQLVFLLLRVLLRASGR